MNKCRSFIYETYMDISDYHIRIFDNNYSQSHPSALFRISEVWDMIREYLISHERFDKENSEERITSEAFAAAIDTIDKDKVLDKVIKTRLSEEVK